MSEVKVTFGACVVRGDAHTAELLPPMRWNNGRLQYLRQVPPETVYDKDTGLLVMRVTQPEYVDVPEWIGDSPG